MTRSMTALALTAAVAVGSFSLPTFTGMALAASDGGSSTSTRTPNCRKNYIYDKRKKKCVKAEKSSGLSDDNLYDAAKSLAYARRYEEALDVIALAADAETPRMLTYKGFATRKLGDVQGALPFYEAALALDPDYTLAREYMGEAFLQIGRVDLAKEQLEEIAARCGTGCAEYTMLAEQIEAAL